MSIRDLTLERLQHEFGAPDSETHDLLCWHVCPGFEMIAQRQTGAEEAVLWVPRTSDHRFDTAQDHPETRMRPMGSYHPCAPSLAPGKPVL